MIKKRETGLSFILVLIILAIGSLIVIPALRLTFSNQKNVAIITGHNLGLNAAASAQTFVMWDLYYGDLMEELGWVEGVNAANYTLDVCGTPVDVYVVMRATELEGGVTLATEHTMMPTKTVDTGLDPSNTVPSESYSGPYTYTITVSQESSNTTAGLDRIYDILSADWKSSSPYKPGTSEISLDGVNWEPLGDPLVELSGTRLRWPNPDTYGSENFISPFRDFYTGQDKYLRFQVDSQITNNVEVVCNYVMLLVGESTLTVSSAQAPIFVGDTEKTECDSGGVFTVTTESDPTVIPPLVETEVTYTITITSNLGSVEGVYNITSILPPGFTYTGPTTTAMTSPENEGPNEPELTVLNGAERYVLVWGEDQLGNSGYSLGAGDNITLTFVATAEQGISGNYYNEVLVSPKNFPIPQAFAISDPPIQGAYDTSYSWRTGVIIVPAYDASTTAEGANITANLSVDPETVSILSWTAE
ncbi:hypothetical protein ACFLTO_02700 [Chloroflexota bacterium]